jgi:hypothetical protein
MTAVGRVPEPDLPDVGDRTAPAATAVHSSGHGSSRCASTDPVRTAPPGATRALPSPKGYSLAIASPSPKPYSRAAMTFSNARVALYCKTSSESNGRNSGRSRRTQSTEQPQQPATRAVRSSASGDVPLATTSSSPVPPSRRVCRYRFCRDDQHGGAIATATEGSSGATSWSP